MQHLNVSWCWKRAHAESKREESRKRINLTCSHSIQLLSCVWLFATSRAAARQACLSFNSGSWLKLMSMESVMPSNHPTLCRPLQSFWTTGSFPMGLFFTSRGQSIGLSNSASVLPMNIQDWFPLGSTGLISMQSEGFQHHSSKASILQHSAFFVFQLSHPYVTTGKTIALTTWTYFGKVYLCFLICCLGWSQLFFQGVSIF